MVKVPSLQIVRPPREIAMSWHTMQGCIGVIRSAIRSPLLLGFVCDCQRRAHIRRIQCSNQY
ncbi:hypothetical protein BALAC2494_01689 [Bifidobacterium animalis subsp. lactis CNCM I-2494]|uniref:Uncharacterized protein n=1 Tax=Bifidobacterium animalis subsp. lactis CNCM I-2494 TaxID=1042403 RepID=A0A806FVV5_BIFAN|nr:hypothetical protein BALAC2494_01689 [Bifidobacterium animalis subsp. lactis CNCM I-2494]